jgi:hypothetical protein
MSAPSTPAATARTVDVLFGGFVAIAVAYGWWLTRGNWFFVDDWPVLRQSRSLSGIVDHYNGALSLVSLALYRVVTELFGLEYTPLRLAGVAALCAVPVTYYVTTRRRWGPLLAAVVSLCLLSATGATFIPQELNHSLALVAGMVCAAALPRGPRADVWLSLALGLSLAAAGGGLTVAVACIVYSGCVRAPVRRFIAIGVPIALWGIWWLVIGRDYQGGIETTLAIALRKTWRLTVESFTSIAAGSPLLGTVLMLAFLAYGTLGLRKGLAHRATWLAWVAALVTWGVGLTYNRGVLVDPDTFRYQLVAIGCIALAVVPRDPPRLPGWLGATTRAPVAALVLLAVFAVQARHLVVEGRAVSQVVARSGTLNRGRAVALAQEPSVVPDDLRLPLEMGGLTARQARALLEDLDALDPATGDRQLVDLGVPVARSAGTRRDVSCDPLTAPFEQPANLPRVRLWSPGPATAIEVRRFGDEWLPLHTAGAGEVVRLFLPALESEVPWQVRAVGACVLGAQEEG